MSRGKNAWSRRRFLAAGAAGSAWIACDGGAIDVPAPPQRRRPDFDIDPSEFDGATPVLADPFAVVEDLARFPLGLSTGGPRKDRVQVRGLRAPEVPPDAQTELWAWRPSETEGEIAQVARVPMAVGDAGHLAFVLEGLAPATWYLLCFVDVDDDGEPIARSSIARTQTAWPDEARWPLRVSGLACTEDRPFEALLAAAAAADEDPLDLVVHLGDLSYNDGAGDLAAYRAKYRETLSDPGYRALLATAPLVSTWDDHEFGAAPGGGNIDFETLDPGLLDAARRAYFEATPSEDRGDGRLYNRYRYGRTAELFVVDSRTERRRGNDGEARRYLSEAQMEWLKLGLRDSECAFKIVLNSVPVTQMSELWLLQGDRWQGFPDSRDELLDWIVDEDIGGVVFLAGDFHVGFVARVEADGPRSRLFEVAVGPSGNLGNPLAALVELDPGEYREQVFPTDQFLYGKGAIAHTELRFDPFDGSLAVRFQRPDGEVLFEDRLVIDGAATDAGEG